MLRWCDEEVGLGPTEIAHLACGGQTFSKRYARQEFRILMLFIDSLRNVWLPEPRF